MLKLFYNKNYFYNLIFYMKSFVLGGQRFFSISKTNLKGEVFSHIYKLIISLFHD